MLRLEDGTCPLRRCGICEKSVDRSGYWRTIRGTGYDILRDNGSISPAIQFSVTSNHTPRSMLLTMLDESLSWHGNFVCTLPLLQ